MDLFQAAEYFDLQRFQNYDFTAGDWGATFFEGQLKKGDLFQTIYHRPTRKRMLFTAPGQEPGSPVVRVETTGEPFMVGNLQQDSHQNTHYRNVYALHRPMGMATIYRRLPTGPSSNPGWGVVQEIETTFVDLELRNTNENEEAIPAFKAHYFVTLPSNCQVQRYDLLVIDGLPYYVLESYVDSMLRMCRAAQHIDPRENFVYKHRVLPDTYSGGQVTEIWTNYNVTARVGPLQADEAMGGISATSLKVKIQEGWIGVTPRLDDKITIYGSDYSVKRIIRDATEQEWNLVVSL